MACPATLPCLLPSPALLPLPYFPTLPFASTALPTLPYSVLPCPALLCPALCLSSPTPLLPLSHCSTLFLSYPVHLSTLRCPLPPFSPMNPLLVCDPEATPPFLILQSLIFPWRFSAL